MKKIVFVLFFIMVGIVFYLRSQPVSPLPLLAKKATPIQPQITATTTSTISNSSIFVPYWVLNGKALATSEYNSVIYFGITANNQGIDTEDDGYKKLSEFNNDLKPETPTLLTLRMLDTDSNFSILEKKDLQQKVIAQTISLAKENDFSGIVLDLELNALPFDSVINNITSLTRNFSSAAKQENLSFSITMYGDTFYRFRPFNVSEIAKNVDMIYIMAYDFSKARGNPGPNFPLAGKETYGYDFQTMTSDFLAAVPAEKLSVIFGRYGYDWQVDDKGKSSIMATSLSEYKIKQQFIDSCSEKDCQLQRDDKSAEQHISYIDTTAHKHVIWFEDAESVARKSAILEQKGISHVSYWGYSYF